MIAGELTISTPLSKAFSGSDPQNEKNRDGGEKNVGDHPGQRHPAEMPNDQGRGAQGPGQGG